MAEDHLGRGTILSLGAMAVAIFVVANDFTSLSVALPAIERTFHADVSTVQWTINAYALGFGVLTVIGGRFADQLGRRKVFVTGAAIFAGCSLVAALSPTVGVLIAARAVMAVGGALMWPATLGMTYGLLPAARRGLAGGLILGVVGLGNAAGPLVGGVLTDTLGWRWILGLNVPVAAVAVLVVLLLVPESRDEHAEHRVDWAGMAFLTGSLVALLLALDIVTTSSWSSPTVIGLLVGSAVLMAAVVVIERRTGPWALIPREVAANRRFRAALMAVLFMSMTFFTALVYLPQFMEKLLGLSALNAGLGMLPLMAIFGASSFAAGRLYERLGGKRVVIAGAACLPLAMLVLSLVTLRSGYLTLVPGMLLLGLGTGLFYSAVFTEAVSSLDPERASLASGIIYMFQVAGGSVGLGIATTIVASAAGAEARAGGRAGASFVRGLEETFRVSALLAAVGFVISLLWVGGSARSLAIPVAPPAPAPTQTAAAPELA
ncbi:MAG TPA: MFS transporter [Acidimicrobiales bacterium]|jgi:EmrB/QacA subfamily drug resistance transporter|nr:MFS transporter [Acidimicrobiales bacterium]